MTLAFSLPGAPKGKGRPRFVRATGRTYSPADTVSYENAIKFAAHQAMGARPLIDKAVELRVTAVFPIPASWPKRKWADAVAGVISPTVKPDCDNVIKSVADALNGVVWHDDKQIVRATIWKKYGEKPELLIYVDELAGDAA